MKRLIGCTVIILLAAGCQEELMVTDLLGENADIVGTWVRQEVQGQVTILMRSAELDPSEYGFRIREDGSFIERKNAGWCGTPPISYKNYQGSWEALSDSLLQITVGYWGGTISYQIRVVSMDPGQLKIKYLYADERKTAR